MSLQNEPLLRRSGGLAAIVYLGWRNSGLRQQHRDLATHYFEKDAHSVVVVEAFEGSEEFREGAC